MAGPSLEERVTALEAEVAHIKVNSTDKSNDKHPWWEQIRGIFKDDPDYAEAMRLGREYRESPRPKEEDEAPLW